MAWPRFSLDVCLGGYFKKGHGKRAGFWASFCITKNRSFDFLCHKPLEALSHSRVNREWELAPGGVSSPRWHCKPGAWRSSLVQTDEDKAQREEPGASQGVIEAASDTTARSDSPESRQSKKGWSAPDPGAGCSTGHLAPCKSTWENTSCTCQLSLTAHSSLQTALVFQTARLGKPGPHPCHHPRGWEQDRKWKVPQGCRLFTLGHLRCTDRGQAPLRVSSSEPPAFYNVPWLGRKRYTWSSRAHVPGGRGEQFSNVTDSDMPQNKLGDSCSK